ncbi:hypothetical protein LG307_14685 [Sutcliffiella horikoshii]|uniref:DUF7662 domain-containing protein n=1 Tax=Sutcliffiella horikoshii TaxID=79883 RepID=UPI00384AD6F7
MIKGLGKYQPLCTYLSNTKPDKNSLTLTFEDIEQILSFKLPLSAYKHNAWWANERQGHVQAKAWLQAGWKTSDTVLGKTITFIRNKENHPTN